MLTNLRIRNFKAWEDTGDIRLAPITLFFGANSSGKSSIGQFLMMLKQTAESPNRKEVLNTGGGNSDAVRLGTFGDMAYGREPNRHIHFEYSWDAPPSRFEFYNPANDKDYSGDGFSFSAEIGLNSQQDAGVTVYRFDYGVNDRGKRLISIGYERNTLHESEYSVQETGYPLIRNDSKRPFEEPVQFYGFPDEVIAGYQNIGFVQDLEFEHKFLFESVYYLGPLRSAPERIYFWNGSITRSVGYRGELAIAALLGSEQTKLGVPGKIPTSLDTTSIYHNPDDELLSIPEIVQRELADMELAQFLSTQRTGQRDGIYEVKVQAQGSRDIVDLPDVGFGVSQILPVIAQCFCAPAGSTIIIEQPEAHLHPRAQAALADVMIDVINSYDSNGIPRNIQLIIETHSEHFLRRLQRRIAESKLPEERVAAYFAEMCEGKAELTPLHIDEFGNITNWPRDFFGDDDNNDILKHSLAAINKKIAMKRNGNSSDHE